MSDYQRHLSVSPRAARAELCAAERIQRVASSSGSDEEVPPSGDERTNVHVALPEGHVSASIRTVPGGSTNIVPSSIGSPAVWCQGVTNGTPRVTIVMLTHSEYARVCRLNFRDRCARVLELVKSMPSDRTAALNCEFVFDHDVKLPSCTPALRRHVDAAHAGTLAERVRVDISQPFPLPMPRSCQIVASVEIDVLSEEPPEERVESDGLVESDDELPYRPPMPTFRHVYSWCMRGSELMPWRIVPDCVSEWAEDRVQAPVRPTAPRNVVSFLVGQVLDGMESLCALVLTTHAIGAFLCFASVATMQLTTLTHENSLIVKGLHYLRDKYLGVAMSTKPVRNPLLSVLVAILLRVVNYLFTAYISKRQSYEVHQRNGINMSVSDCQQLEGSVVYKAIVLPRLEEDMLADRRPAFERPVDLTAPSQMATITVERVQVHTSFLPQKILEVASTLPVDPWGLFVERVSQHHFEHRRAREIYRGVIDVRRDVPLLVEATNRLKYVNTRLDVDHEGKISEPYYFARACHAHSRAMIEEFSDYLNSNGTRISRVSFGATLSGSIFFLSAVLLEHFH